MNTTLTLTLTFTLVFAAAPLATAEPTQVCAADACVVDAPASGDPRCGPGVVPGTDDGRTGVTANPGAASVSAWGFSSCDRANDGSLHERGVVAAAAAPDGHAAAGWTAYNDFPVAGGPFRGQGLHAQAGAGDASAAAWWLAAYDYTPGSTSYTCSSGAAHGALAVDTGCPAGNPPPPPALPWGHVLALDAVVAGQVTEAVGDGTLPGGPAVPDAPGTPQPPDDPGTPQLPDDPGTPSTVDLARAVRDAMGPEWPILCLPGGDQKCRVLHDNCAFVDHVRDLADVTSPDCHTDLDAPCGVTALAGARLDACLDWLLSGLTLPPEADALADPVRRAVDDARRGCLAQGDPAAVATCLERTLETGGGGDVNEVQDAVAKTLDGVLRDVAPPGVPAVPGGPEVPRVPDVGERLDNVWLEAGPRCDAEWLASSAATVTAGAQVRADPGGDNHAEVCHRDAVHATGTGLDQHAHTEAALDGTCLVETRTDATTGTYTGFRHAC